MASPLDQPITCPVLIGRNHYLQAVGQFAHQSAAGHGGVIVISGEAGIGKSRLVAECIRIAATCRMPVLQGDCFEPDRSLPYGPLSDLVRACRVSVADESAAAVVQTLGPELSMIVPEIAAGRGDSSAADGAPEQRKRRLFAALTNLLTGLAALRPLLIVLEDLHWSDDSSLEYILHLARATSRLPIGLVLTYRTDEAFAQLTHLLAELDRSRLATELPLTRLSAGEVEAMLRAIFRLDRPIRTEFLEAIYGLTEGNPFFIEEVLRSLVSSGAIYFADGAWSREALRDLRIPRSIQDAVQRRRDRLSAPAARALAVAAVIGQRIDLSVLQHVTGLDDDGLVRCVKEWVGAQLVIQQPPEQIVFRHALTREAIYTGMLALERRATHRQVAAAVETLYATALHGHPADLAYHYHQAGVWEKAMLYSRQLGERAIRLYAPGAAIDHLTRALDAAAHLSLLPDPELHRMRGHAHESLGAWEPAHADYLAALEAARAGKSLPAEWQALLDLGMLWAGRDYQQTYEYYRRAADLAQASGDASLRAHSANRLGNWYLNVDRPLEARTHHLQALAIFESLADRPGLAATLDFLGMTSYLGADLIQGTRYYSRAVELFRELDDRPGLISSLATMTLRGATVQTDSMVLPEGNLDACIRDGEAALALAREIKNRSGEAYALLMLGFCLGSAGQYAAAQSATAQGCLIAAEIEHRQWMAAGYCVQGYLSLDLLEPEQAATQLQRALTLARETGSSHWMRVASGLLASALLLDAQPAQASEVLEATGDAAKPAETLGERLVWCARIELALARGQAGSAVALLDQMEAATPNLDPARTRAPRLARLRGEALAAEGKYHEAEAAFEAARQVATAQGALPLLWRCEARRADLLQRLGRPAEAKAAGTSMQQVLESLAGRMPDEAAGASFLQRALATLPRAIAARSRRQSTTAAGSLTPREREVVMLIRQGLSNREIARTLYVGERTVETHITNVLAKLNFSTRAQVAAWAVQHGLS